MVIGFLGKGGSGKSSVASQMAFFEQQQGKSILAIDADHNLDLSFNLSAGSVPDMNYLSKSLPELLKATGIDPAQKYTEVFLQNTNYKFTLSPLSPIVEKYSFLLPNEIRLMAAGPQTDEVLHGQKCSHSLATPLKVLLPLLHLQENETVIVDEKAGADGVSTGIVTGIDVGIIVCEPSLHSIKTAKQIAELMIFFDTPFVFVGNKITGDDDTDFIESTLNQSLAICLKDSKTLKQNPTIPHTDWNNDLHTLKEKIKNLKNSNRLKRTTEKFQRNKVFELSQN